MKKINKCPFCGIHQLIKYSEDIILPIEECFDILQAASLEHDTPTAKAELLGKALEDITKHAYKGIVMQIAHKALSEAKALS